MTLDWVLALLYFAFASLGFTIIPFAQQELTNNDVNSDLTSSCVIEYPQNLRREVVTLELVSSSSPFYLTCRLELLRQSDSEPPISKCVDADIEKSINVGKSNHHIRTSSSGPSVKVEQVFPWTHRGIWCNSSHVISVRVEYLDTNGTFFKDDDFLQSRMDADDDAAAGEDQVPTEIRNQYQVFIKTDDTVTTRYRIQGQYLPIREDRGEFSHATPQPTITALVMSWHLPPVTDEDGLLGLFTPTGQTEFVAMEETVLVPCLDMGLYLKPHAYLYEGEPKSNSCIAAELHPPTFYFDEMAGFYFNMSHLSKSPRNKFLCCWDDPPPGSNECPEFSCIEFNIVDPPDLVVKPDTPSCELTHLLSTNEDKPIATRFDCNYHSPIAMHVSHIHGMSMSMSTVDPAENGECFGIIPGHGHAEQRQQGGSNVSGSSLLNGSPHWETRYHVFNTTEIQVGDSLFVYCYDLWEPLEGDLHVWGIWVHNVGSSNPNTTREYLTVSVKTRTQSGNHLAEPIGSEVEVEYFQCESGAGEVRLEVIQCVNELQCRLLEWCFESDACATWEVVQSGEPCPEEDVHVHNDFSCQQIQVPTVAGLFRCTAGNHTFTQLRWLGLSGSKSYVYLAQDFTNDTLNNEIVALEPGAPGQVVDIYYTHALYNFSCRVHRFWSNGRLRFQVAVAVAGPGGEEDDDSLEMLNSTNSGSFMDPSTGTFNEWVEWQPFSPEVTRILCNAPKSDVEDLWVTTGMRLRVVKSEPPAISNNETSIALKGNREQVIVCDSSGQPPPKMKWVLKDSVGEETEITADQEEDVHVIEGDHKLGLKFRAFVLEHEGLYACSSENDVGTDSLDFEVSLLPEEPETNNKFSGWIILGATSGGVVLVLFGGIALTRYLFFRPRRIIDQVEMNKFRFGANYGMQSDGSTAAGEPHASPSDGNGATILEEQLVPKWHQDVLDEPFDLAYEIKHSKFKVRKDKLLGSGEYANVYEGLLNVDHAISVRIAVKVPHEDCSDIILKGLLKEIKIMTKLKYQHVVSLVGANTTRAEYGRLFILMEFCEHGSMGQYLDKNRCHYVHAAAAPKTKSNYKSTTEVLEISLEFNDLVRWSAEVASGLEFLSSMGIIHRDVAARNILVTKDLTAKVSDFGLSRQLVGHQRAYEQQTAELKLPLRWMAPECFQVIDKDEEGLDFVSANGQFSTYSDVWAYGITVWEIFSLGKEPYAEINVLDDIKPTEFAALLRNGLRIKESHQTTPEIFQVLCNCWSLTPEDRPSFNDLKNFFGQIVKQEPESRL